MYLNLVQNIRFLRNSSTRIEESFEHEPKVVHQINREHLVRTNSERVLTHSHIDRIFCPMIAFSK